MYNPQFTARCGNRSPKKYSPCLSSHESVILPKTFLWETTGNIDPRLRESRRDTVGKSTRPGAREAGQEDAGLKTRNRKGEQRLYRFVLIGMKQTVT